MILLSTWPRRIYRLTLLPPLLLPFPASGPREASVRTTNKFLQQKDTGSLSYDCSPLMNFVWLTVSSARDSKPLGCMRQRTHRRVQKEIDIAFFRYLKCPPSARISPLAPFLSPS